MTLSENKPLHRTLLRAALVVEMIATTLLAFGHPAWSAAQEQVTFAPISDTGETTYEESSLQQGGASYFRGATVAGTTIFFAAYTPETGIEMWRSDGTTQGTFLLKDIDPGEGDGIVQFSGSGIETPVAIGSSVYFLADDGIAGTELWTSDGTKAGTHRLKDINPGPDNSDINNVVRAKGGGPFFFTAYDGATSTIWRSDGTEGGTVSTGVQGLPLFRTSSYIFFSTAEGGVCKLKQMSLTSNDVHEVAPICPGSIYSNPSAGGISIAAGTNLAYFTAGDSSTGTEVWRTDGTPAGTFLLRDIWSGAESSRPSDFFVDSSDQLFFSATDGFYGQEVWLSDGTSANTFRLKDINSGSKGSYPSDFAQWKGIVYFTAYDGTQQELWRTNGRGDGTSIFKDLAPTIGALSNPHSLTATSKALFFTANDDTHKQALFKIDTVLGVVELVKDIDPTTANSKIDLAVPFKDGIFFAGNDGVHGNEPWVSDGTDAGTHLMANIAGPTRFNPRPAFVTPLNGRALVMHFRDAPKGEPQYALDASDGTADGTRELKTFGITPSYPNDTYQTPAILNGALYFAATGTFTQGEELWRSDGTADGTALAADIATAPNNSSEPQWLTPSGQTLYFAAADGVHGVELWKTGGTAETTTLVKDILPGNSGSFPKSLTPDGTSGVFFSAYDSTNGEELWHSDGTADGTRMVIDLQPGSDSSYPQNLTRVGSSLFFTANGGNSGRELWMSDGTVEGTHLVRDITPGPGNTGFEPYEHAFPVLGNCIFFVAASNVFGNELWASDGTESGTAIVKDVYSGPLSSNIDELTVINGTLYFAATSDTNTRTLWRSDGTTAGTQPVVSGPGAPVNPEALSAVDGRLYFSAADQAATAGRELWVSDGTAAGTHMQQDLNPGPVSGNPRDMVQSGDQIFLSAYTPDADIQLWAARIPSQTPPPNQTPQPDQTPWPTQPVPSSNHQIYLPLVQR